MKKVIQEVLSLSEQLKYYKIALQDYTDSIGEDMEVKEAKQTNLGFCNYFKEVHNLDFSQLSILNEMFLKDSFPWFPWDYWFEEGLIEHRIEKLLIAIDKIENDECDK